MNDPFDVEDCRLRSLGSGVSAAEGDGVNCDNAEQVGSNIMTKLDNCAYAEVVMKKADRVKTLADITTAVSMPHNNVISVIILVYQPLKCITAL